MKDQKLSLKEVRKKKPNLMGWKFIIFLLLSCTSSFDHFSTFWYYPDCLWSASSIYFNQQFFFLEYQHHFVIFFFFREQLTSGWEIINRNCLFFFFFWIVYGDRRVLINKTRMLFTEIRKRETKMFVDILHVWIVGQHFEKNSTGYLGSDQKWMQFFGMASKL